ncbi:MAG TPA: putative Ig domain-containing protein [Steroidobacteraceae bacterium]|nr:putative Ig domain-containing protein [Steroidobacteraceae bacterium]
MEHAMLRDGKVMATTTMAKIGARLFVPFLILALAGCGGGSTNSASTSASNSSVTSGSTTTTNQPPTISGTPPTTATTGTAYAFQPTVSDPNGKTLTFSITGKPAWATFNATTGALTGTPASTDTGTFANIVIAVSDGAAQAALPAFTITVSAPVTGSATLSWQAPTQNTDGTPLTDLAGYVVHYGTSPSNLSQSISLKSASTTTVEIDNLAQGTWYFTLNSVNSNGVESSPTAAVSKTIG